MTPALKAMVEAMAAEMEGQQEEAERLGSPLSEEGYLVDYDLEKVARAGLLALADLAADAGGIFEIADNFEVYGMPILMAQSVFDTVLAENPEGDAVS